MYLKIYTLKKIYNMYKYKYVYICVYKMYIKCVQMFLAVFKISIKMLKHLYIFNVLKSCKQKLYKNYTTI